MTRYTNLCEHCKRCYTHCRCTKPGRLCVTGECTHCRDKVDTMTQEEWKEYVRNLEECEVEYPDSPTSNDSEDCEVEEDE